MLWATPSESWGGGLMWTSRERNTRRGFRPHWAGNLDFTLARSGRSWGPFSRCGALRIWAALCTSVEEAKDAKDALPQGMRIMRGSQPHHGVSSVPLLPMNSRWAHVPFPYHPPTCTPVHVHTAGHTDPILQFGWFHVAPFAPAPRHRRVHPEPLLSRVTNCTRSGICGYDRVACDGPAPPMIMDQT